PAFKQQLHRRSKNKVSTISVIELNDYFNGSTQPGDVFGAPYLYLFIDWLGNWVVDWSTNFTFREGSRIGPKLSRGLNAIDVIPRFGLKSHIDFGRY
ncbi:hypothetical protein SFRURICE_018955, partial [Spodoptera frugiperda]